LAPFVTNFAGELEAAVEAGLVEVDNRRQRATAMFLTTVSHLCSLVLAESGSDLESTADYVASRFCLRGVGIKQ
jgi:hypothetical protein